MSFVILSEAKNLRSFVLAAHGSNSQRCFALLNMTPAIFPRLSEAIPGITLKAE
jgi:hypothetical protein